MTAEILSVGTELLLGNIVNTNACYLSEKLASLGIGVYVQTTVGDNADRLREAIRLALSRADLVVMTGGLGPTPDDLSKEIAAECFGMELEEDPAVREQIAAYFQRRGTAPDQVPDNNWKQALVPRGAKILANPNGTAPGFLLEKGNKAILLLPGPPAECKPMFENEAIPWLKQKQPGVFYSVMVRMVGIGESAAAARIRDLIENSVNPTVAPYAKPGEVHIRVTAAAADEAEAKSLTEPVVNRLYEEFGSHIYTTDESETLEQNIIGMLRERGMTVATAESCTGGKIAARITDVPGASDVFREGYITYANDVKSRLLGVREESIRRCGVVSEQVAREMAEGVRRASGAEAGIGVTGIAGPGGGSEQKPVGLVYIGCSVGTRTVAKRFCFSGNRALVRTNAAQQALVLLRQMLLEETENM